MGSGGPGEAIFRVEATRTGVPLELPVTRQLAALLERRWGESGTLPEGWVFPSTITGMGAGQAISGTWAQHYKPIGEAGGGRGSPRPMPSDHRAHTRPAPRRRAPSSPGSPTLRGTTASRPGRRYAARARPSPTPKTASRQAAPAPAPGATRSHRKAPGRSSMRGRPPLDWPS